MRLTILQHFAVCKDPPTVDNSDQKTVKEIKLLDGSSILSTIEYDCKDNYHINDKSKMAISCVSGTAKWNYTTLPVCLKGLFINLILKAERKTIFKY